MPDSSSIRLYRPERNQLYVVFQASGMSHADFEWASLNGDRDWATVFSVKHRPTNLEFRLSNDDKVPGRYSARWRPHEGRHFNGYSHRRELTWDATVAVVEQWLKDVKEEHLTPDLWETAADAIEVTAARVENDENNRPFTVEERQRVKAALDEFRQHLEATNNLDNQQIDQVRRRIRYLSAAADRFGRLDWFELLVSNIVGLAISGVLLGKGFGEAMHAARTMFGWVIESIRLLGG